MEILIVILACVAVYLAVRVSRLRQALDVARADAKDENLRLGRQVEALEHKGDLLSTEYDTLMQQCGIGVLVLDAIGHIERANDTAAQFFATRPPVMIGKTVLEATLSHELHKLYSQARQTGALRHEVHVSGHIAEYDLGITIAGVNGEGDRPRRYLIIAQNVTDLRRLETVRRDFVANVSHELRTPLTSIRAVAETLQSGAMRDRNVAERFLSMIITESERLSRIADDLLVLSAAESKVPEKREVNLSELLQGAVTRLQEQADRQGVALTAKIPKGIITMASADQMDQVFLNLVDNAIKYTPEHGRVSLCAEQRDDELTVIVSDTGIGIPQQDLPRIFERFYRVDRARSRQTGGTGLGLSIVKHIVESHGGHVTVESDFNCGTTFTVKLPAVVRQPAAAVV